ncbi:MAG: hypothetical protein IJ835_00260, partial [Muribaculaceae bacterium]|nr:hypothetical protein [Muribaculaceae bacterium]
MVISATPIDLPTDVIERLADPEIVSVKYVNSAGLTSNVPFDGLNIVVTTHADGSTTVVKQLR